MTRVTRRRHCGDVVEILFFKKADVNKIMSFKVTKFSLFEI